MAVLARRKTAGALTQDFREFNLWFLPLWLDPVAWLLLQVPRRTATAWTLCFASIGLFSVIATLHRDTLAASVSHLLAHYLPRSEA